MSVDSKISTWEDAVIWLRSQPEQRQLVLDAFYDDPLIAAAERYFAGDEWQAVSQLLQGRTGRALDVGAGRGIASYALAREGFMVTALEPDPSAIVGAARSGRSPPTPDYRSMWSKSFPNACHLPMTLSTSYLREPCCIIPAISIAHAAKCFACFARAEYFVAAREHVISREADLGAVPRSASAASPLWRRACVSSRSLYWRAE